ncbi:MAG TPA: CPBP family intramembrane glutamic endopeptidase [Gillisia sp.]|nr:CPBP family intramembrane glutamic endopeptidase [Gillisia sp.]
MYIQQAFKYQNEFWKYLIGLLVIIVAFIAGQLPLVAAIFMEIGMEFQNLDETQMLQVLDSNLSFFLILLPFAVGLFALFFIVRTLHDQPIRALTTARLKVDWGRVFFGFALVAAYSVALISIDYYLYPEDYVWNFDPIPFAILVVIAIIMVPIQTSVEEYLFRGYLMQGLGTLVKNRWLPLIVTSVVFGGLHFFNPEVTKLGNIIMVYYIGTGFFLGIMTLMDEGLELALGFHAGNNLLTAILVTADWTAFQTNSLLKDISEPQAGWDVLIPVLVVYPIFLLIMAWKYKWKDWSHKLFGKIEEPVMLNPSEEG